LKLSYLLIINDTDWESASFTFYFNFQVRGPLLL